MEEFRHVMDGYTVLDFTQMVAGPTAGRLMADLGAEVIKIEMPPRGDGGRAFAQYKDGHSAFFVQHNRGKKSLCVNPKTPIGRARHGLLALWHGSRAGAGDRPTLGGWITDNYNWRWIFFINLPVGIISLLLTHRMIEDPPHLIEEKKRAWARGLNIDYIGLGLIALGLGTLQVVLDKGQEDDWFASTFITGFAIIAIISLIAFTVWEWLRKDPIVDVRMLGQRTFGVANFLMFVVGVVLYGTTVLLPQFTQTLLGYTAERAGMALSPGGFAIILVMPLVGRLTSRVDGRKLIAFGLAVSGLALYHMTTLDLNVDFRTVMFDRVYQALGLAFLFIPINTMAYVGVAPEDNNQVSGIINLFRNLGGSVGISIVSTLIARRAQIHQDTLSLHTNNYHSAFSSAVNGLGNAYVSSGSSVIDAAHHGLAQFYMSMQAQASMLAYLDTLWLLAMACFAIIPLVFLMKKNLPGKTEIHAH